MNLAIFDIDGTLLDNHAAEAECYTQALCERLELPSADSEWSTYEHVSDDGIASEAYRRHHGRPLTPELRAAAIARFVELLDEASQAGRIGMIRGADALLAELRARGWAIALATGAWRDAATLKLRAGGLRVEGLPIATSEDGPARVEIVSVAMQRAAQAYGVSGFSRTVSIGDGVWDVDTARRLALPFVGVGTGMRKDKLVAAGAAIVLTDFTDVAGCYAALERAPMPV